MAFSYDGSNLPYLSTYAEAAQFWVQADKWKGEDNKRVLDNRNKHYVTIRKLSDESIACQLHRTDVVTYHPDNTLTLEPWASVSTDKFAGHLLRGTNIDVNFNQGLVKVRGDSDRFYQTHPLLVLRYDSSTKRYSLVNEPEPFEISMIDRKEANKVLKTHNYKAFSRWTRMIAVSDIRFERSYRAERAQFILPNRDKWESLLQYESAHYGGLLDVDKTLASVRESLYKDNPQVYDVVTKPYLTTWSEVEQWKRSRYR